MFCGLRFGGLSQNRTYLALLFLVFLFFLFFFVLASLLSSNFSEPSSHIFLLSPLLLSFIAISIAGVPNDDPT